MGSFSSNNFRTAESCRANGVGGGYTRTTEAFCDPDSNCLIRARLCIDSSICMFRAWPSFR